MLIVALDFPSADQALRFIEPLSPDECILKVGLQLYVASGPKFNQVRRYSRHVMRAYTTLSRGKGSGITPVKSRKVSLKKSKSKKYNSSKKKRSLRLSKKTYKKTR